MNDINNPSGMRPEVGDTELVLPITFDYSGGRAESRKSKRLWSAIVIVIGIIVSIGIMRSKDLAFPIDLIIGLGVFFLVLLFVRYALLNEKKVRADYKELEETDSQLGTETIWGIYSVSLNYPYICRFRNGKSGIFIRLTKDVILGKYADAEYEHYEAIGDAYNIAGASRVQIVHIDYMVNVGTDDRLASSFESLSNVSNPDLKDILTEIFSYQQEQMLNSVTTYDVYAFLWTGSDISAWNTINKILSCFLDANYRGYVILNDVELRELVKAVFNLEEFSVNQASGTAFKTSLSASLVPIEVVHANGIVEKLNKTTAEKKTELAEKTALAQAVEEEKKRKKQERKNAKKKKKDKHPKEEYDLFD